MSKLLFIVNYFFYGKFEREGAGLYLLPYLKKQLKISNLTDFGKRIVYHSVRCYVLKVATISPNL